MGKYTEQDAAQDTKTSTSKVAKAWHQAREDAQKSGDLPERKASKRNSGKSKKK